MVLSGLEGMTTRAHETTEALLDWVQGQHSLPGLLTAYSFCGQLALVRGEVEEAAHWLELVGEQAVVGQDTFFEDPPITRARLLLARGNQASVTQGQAPVRWAKPAAPARSIRALTPPKTAP